jgi:hypothetical protein
LRVGRSEEIIAKNNPIAAAGGDEFTSTDPGNVKENQCLGNFKPIGMPTPITGCYNPGNPI